MAAAQPWLSVVMPVHCGMRDLPATLASAASERPDGVEFLIYDSSPDGACRGIVESYADRLSIRYRSMPDVPGWPEKTNLAVAQARARHIALLHQDDLWQPGHLDALRRSIADAPDVVIHVASSLLIDEAGRHIGQWSPPFRPGPWSGADFGRRLIVQNFIAIPSPVIRRDAWLAVGGMDPTLWYTADWDLYLKLAARGSIMVRPRPTTAFRIHGRSLTMTGSRDVGALRAQLDSVRDRHGATFGLNRNPRLRARVDASIAINCGLAEVAGGHIPAIRHVLLSLLRLGPFGAFLYLRDSRLFDRLLPRLKLRAAGVL